MAKHVEQVRKLRQERNLSTSDLPAPANEKDNNGNDDE
jgi:hypothetical protein